MKQLLALMLALSIPTAAMAACKTDKEKFCKDVGTDKAAMGDCLKQHASELSDTCKAQLDVKAKEQGPKENKQP